METKARLYRRSEELSSLLSIEDNPALEAERTEINRRLFDMARQDFAIQQEARNLGFRD